MIKYYLVAASLTIVCSALVEMTTNITAYNQCMMQSRLSVSQNNQDAIQSADDILQSCEPKLDDLKQLLTDNNVNPGLTEGMAKTLRSKAARQLMAQTMNNMAAQAAAMDNIESNKK